MTIKSILKVLDFIDSNGIARPYLNKKFAASPDEIAIAEEKIGYKFPASYRYFLEKFGTGDFKGVEFYGIVPGRLDLEEIPNALWITLDKRKNESLPNDLFVIESIGDGANVCLFLSKMNTDECPLVMWDYGEIFNRENPNIIAKNFGDYFCNKLMEVMME